MASRARYKRTGGGAQGARGKANRVSCQWSTVANLSSGQPESPTSSRSPLYEAQNASRYERQGIIRDYEREFSCQLVVLIDQLFPNSITPFEETLYDAAPEKNLHVMLSTLGGDSETALRLIRQAQSRCCELTVIVPDQAKSAGTLFALGADYLYLGPTSDLGPIDPQFLRGENQLIPAKAIIAAVEDAEQRVEEKPQTYPLHASLLSDISALMVQQARDALARAGDQLREALACASRTEEQVKKMAKNLHAPLIDDMQSHRASISAQSALELGLPVQKADPTKDRQWQAIWRLWAKYAVLNPARVYEGRHASFVVYPPNP